MTERTPVPPTPDFTDCDHAEGCLCVSAGHDRCCAYSRELVLASLAEYDTEKGPTAQQVADSRFLEEERQR